MSKFKRNISETIKFLRLVQIENKSLAWIIVVGALSTSAIPYVHLLCYSKMLNLIEAGRIKESIPLIAAMLVSALILGLISRACAQLIDYLAIKSIDSTERRTAAKAYRMEYEEFEKTETMDAVRKMKNHVDGSGGIGSQLKNIHELLRSLFTILFAFLFVALLCVKTASLGAASMISLLVGIFFCYSVMILAVFKILQYSNRNMVLYSEQNVRYNTLSTYIISSATDYKKGKDIRLYGMQNLLADKYDEMSERYVDMYLNWTILEGKSTALIALMSAVAAGIVYYLISVRAASGLILIADVLMFAGAITRLAESITSAVTNYNLIVYRNQYLKTYDEFINRPNMHYDGTLPIEKREDAEYEFEFQDVSFQYPNTDVLVLDHVNLKIKVGDKLAIVGRNGAGKTTFIKLLCRLYEPSGGRILLNGMDISLFDYEEYTRIFSVVFQDFKLFSFGVDENIASGGKIEEKRIREVLDQVGMKERVERMKDGIHTRLYQNNGAGIDVSQGEAQKLAIARALYKDAPFIILDEPTAALDPLSEAEIYENFNRMVSHKTAIYISHRMSSCKFCDHIVVFDKGRIQEQGSHEQLLEKGGIYASLYNAQAQYYQ